MAWKASGKGGLPRGGTPGQVVAKKSAADYDADWQDTSGVSGTFGGELSTYADLVAFATPSVGYYYIVSADESQANNPRTYYLYDVGGIWRYMGAFSDGMAGGGGSGYNRQWNSPGTVTAGETKVLPVSYTATFNAAVPMVLKFESGSADQIAVVCEFDNGSASSFSYDTKSVEFVGTGSGSGSQMRLKTTYVSDFVKQAPAGSAEYASAMWDFGAVKLTESVVVA